MSVEKKVLIIDDETDFCLLLKEYFTRKNYNVYLSHTLGEGKKILTEICPDILFLDNNLPDGLGWVNAPEIARNLPLTYIVLISAFHPEAPQMPDSSHYRILEKPMSMKDLDYQLNVI